MPILALGTGPAAVIGGTLLFAYMVLTWVALTTPANGPDPQRGQAVGCLQVVAVALAGLLGLMALGWMLEWDWLVRALFWVAVWPIALLAFVWIREGCRRIARR